jgi:hypothetical protein
LGASKKYQGTIHPQPSNQKPPTRMWCGVVWCGTLYDVRSNSCSFSPSPSHMSIGCVGGTFKTLLLYCTVQSRVREQKAGETISVLHEKRPERDTAAPYSYLSKLCRTSFASTSMSRPTVSAWHSVVMSLSSHTTPSLRVVLTSNLTSSTTPSLPSTPYITGSCM